MTSTLDDARGELLARAERYISYNAAESGADVLIMDLIAALRAAPVPQCDAECATPARAMQILKEISELPEDLQFYIASALVSPPSEAGREMVHRTSDAPEQRSGHPAAENEAP